MLIVLSGSAQIPMPGWTLSDAMEAQCGVVNYTNEKFDFGRLSMPRSISDFFHLRDTLVNPERKNIFRTRIYDNGGDEVALLTLQRDPQVARNDTTTFVSANSQWLQVTTFVHLVPGASQPEIDRAVDSLRNIRILPEGADILPAHQDGISYALQYLFARRGVDTSVIFNWETYLSGADNKAAILGYCCDKQKELKIGSDIERFARKAKFSEEYIYVCVGPNANRNFNVAFFYCDGKFWAKIGASQYLSFDSVISLWRHYKDADRIACYKLKDKFE